MKEKKHAAKKILVMVMAVMVLFTMTPDTAEAAAKKAVTVSVKSAKKTKSKYALTVKKASQLTVKYAGKNVTKKAVYKTSNKKVATVSKKGRVTAKKAGTVTITVKYKGKTKKLKFVVNSASKKGSSAAAGSTKKNHTHVWKAHKVEDKVWVPKIVTVDDYETKTIDIMVCWCGARIPYNPDNGYKEVDEHGLKHLFAGESTGSQFDTEYIKVKVGSHEEDHGSYKVTGSHVDYYYCSCGAKK